MNGKQAKRLRRAAMGLAVTLDQAGRKIAQNGHTVQEHTIKVPAMISAMINDPDTVPEQKAQVLQIANSKTGKVTHHNRKDSLRGIYRAIKQGVAEGKIPKGAK